MSHSTHNLLQSAASMLPSRAWRQMLQHTWARALCGATFIAAMTQVTVPYAGPVPFTLQAQAVIIVAALMGGSAGRKAVGTYLVAAGMGLPVLAGGQSGMPIVMGPHLGYLLSYIVTATVVGTWARRPTGRSLLVWLGSSLVTIAMGTAVLAAFIGWSQAWRFGAAPFIIADLCKTAAAWAAMRLLGATCKISSMGI